MDMSVQPDDRSLWQRVRSPEGFTATANYFVMDWTAVARDVFGGLVIAGALVAWVPDSFWRHFFLEQHGTLARFWGASRRSGRRDRELRLLDRQRAARRRAVERRHQLRRRPQLHLRRPDHPPDPRHLPPLLRLADGRLPARELLRDDGRRGARGRVLLPGGRARATRAERQGRARLGELDYTTYLNIVFLVVAGALLWRYFRRGGGLAMLRMMDEPIGEGHHHHAHVHSMGSTPSGGEPVR
jgi:hypothetical protein